MTEGSELSARIAELEDNLELAGRTIDSLREEIHELDDAVDQAWQTGYDDGSAEGYHIGHADGYESGLAEGISQGLDREE